MKSSYKLERRFWRPLRRFGGAVRLSPFGDSEIETYSFSEIATLPRAVKLPSAVKDVKVERKRAMDHGTRYDVPKGQRTWYRGTRPRVRGIM